MNFVGLLIFFGAGLSYGQGTVSNVTETANFQNDDRFFIKPYPILENIFGLDPEVTMSTIGIVQHRGYPIEVHTVFTDDDYILTMHRIPHGKTRTAADPALLPILLIHGSFGFADYFLASTTENSFAYLLADAGFDVFVANLRGTQHSHLHKTLSTRDSKYWEFSIDETAKYDIPAFVDKMLSLTGKSKVFLSGHSLGGGLPILMLTARPEYNSKVKAVFSLAPFGNMENFSPFAKPFAPLVHFVNIFTDLTGVYELLKIPAIIQGYFGKYAELPMRILTELLVGTSGFGQWDAERLQINMGHFPSSMGLNIVYHLVQLVVKNGLRKFDWGSVTNKKKYGQSTPPDYDLTNVTVPCHLYYGSHDWFCTKENVEFLQRNLPNGILHEAGNGFNHLDFIWGRFAGKSFYNCLVPFIKNINSRP